jgi:peptide/nickel transport system permease protein
MTGPVGLTVGNPDQGGRIAPDPAAIVRANRPPSLARRFMRNRGAVVGAAILATIALLALLGPLIVPIAPIEAFPADQLAPPGVGHLLGADQFGRDVAARILWGAPLSLQIGFISIAFAVALGVLLGLPAGYFAGWVDMVVMRCVDVLLAFPSILLALSIVSVLGANLTNAMVAVGISVVPIYVRLVRGSTLAARELLYVEAAHVIGVRDRTIMIRHLLPNIVGPLVIVATLGVASAIITGASLSFLGLGAQPPSPEWGAMLNDGRGFLQTAWWLSAFPGIAIMITVLAINLIGDGLRDMLDPRMRM